MKTQKVCDELELSRSVVAVDDGVEKAQPCN